MEKLEFSFYSILKNEDVQPYITDNYIFAADGLGGSGGFTHELSEELRANVEKTLHASAFADFDKTIDGVEEFLNGYVANSIKILQDEVKNTSARWGSRIATIRAIYALRFSEQFKNADLSDEKVRKELSNYVHIGLEETAKAFELKAPPINRLALLPTTLCFIKYAEKEDSVEAEVVWAGDSRCYAIVDGQLKKISIDDENKSGEITNLFYVDGDFRATLNYKKFTLKKPCCLMCVSDGIFDPFGNMDSIGVEATILNQIVNNDNIGSLCNNLKTEYAGIGGDDITMAFVGCGYKDYSHLKQDVSLRAEEICAFWKKYCELKTEIEILKKPESDLYDIQSRTKTIYSRILPIIVDCVENDRQDIIVEPIRNYIIEKNKEKLQEKIKDLKSKKQAVLKNLVDLIKEPREYANNAFNIFRDIYSKIKVLDKYSLKDFVCLQYDTELELKYKETISCIIQQLEDAEKQVVLAEESINKIILPKRQTVKAINKIQSPIKKNLLSIKRSFLEYTEAILKVKEPVKTYLELSSKIQEKVKELCLLKEKADKATLTAKKEKDVFNNYNDLKNWYETYLNFNPIKIAKVNDNKTPIFSTFKNIANLFIAKSDSEDSIEQKINEKINNCKTENDEINKFVKSLTKSFETSTKKDEYIGYLSDEVIASFELEILSEPDDCGISVNLNNQLIEEVIQNNKEDICLIIYQCFKDRFLSTSVIDSLYTAALLKEFRTWYKVEKTQKEKIQEISEKIEKYLQEYLSLFN